MLSQLMAIIMAVVCFSLGVMAERHGLLRALDQHWDDVRFLALQHLQISLGAAGLALLAGVPLGVFLSRWRSPRWVTVVLQGINIGAAIPVLAILALVAGVLGVGMLPALLVLWLAALLPIVRSTYTGFHEVSQALCDIALGLGMQPRQVLWRVEFPLALPTILAGVRTAFTVSISVASLVALVGAGGLGELIFTGIALNDTNLMLLGGIPAASLALLLDALLLLLSTYLVPQGILWQQRVGISL